MTIVRNRWKQDRELRIEDRRSLMGIFKALYRAPVAWLADLATRLGLTLYLWGISKENELAKETLPMVSGDALTRVGVAFGPVHRELDESYRQEVLRKIRATR